MINPIKSAYTSSLQLRAATPRRRQVWRTSCCSPLRWRPRPTGQCWSTRWAPPKTFCFLQLQSLWRTPTAAVSTAAFSSARAALPAPSPTCPPLCLALSTSLYLYALCSALCLCPLYPLSFSACQCLLCMRGTEDIMHTPARPAYISSPISALPMRGTKEMTHPPCATPPASHLFGSADARSDRRAAGGLRRLGRGAPNPPPLFLW